jgi:2-dehydro-3-deoxygluconokinase
MKNKVITLGEILLRLSTPGFARFTQANSFQALYAGSEANVAASLCHLGIPAAHVTRFPDNDLGKAAVQTLRRWGVDTQYIVFGPGRMAIYFLENGSMQRPSRVIYDRFDSAFANVERGMINWDEVFADATWFHWTGITPALSQGAADLCRDAISAARRKGITVSGDINYRRNLWQYGKTAQDIMPALITGTDIVVAGITDMENCAGVTGATFEEACRAFMKAFPQVKKMTTTIRDSVSSSHNRLTGILWNGQSLVSSQPYELTHIVDRVGGGDAYMAGLIYGILTQKSDAATVEFATAASSLKHSIEGDVNLVTVEEVEALVKGENVGKLLR